MSNSSIVAQVTSGDRLECRVTASNGHSLTLNGAATDLEPEAEGSDSFVNNRALISNAWAFTIFTYESVSLPEQEQQKFAAKRAQDHSEVARWIADVADELTDETRDDWCSACFGHHAHRKAEMPVGHVPAYVCSDCGSPTLECAGPRCEHMAVRKRGAIRAPQYCAEHRHEIPGFEKAADRMGSLGDYREFLQFDKKNLRRSTRIAGAALGAAPIVASAALLAGPAIGGAIGTMIGGYSGAAATSYGLALVGGGSLAAGGLGMAGGTAVITALGGAVGGVLGASITNAYVREDKSFHIELLSEGPGPTVIICNGFLSESGKGWGEWKNIVRERYPNSTVYRVHWGAKELGKLGALIGGGAAKGFALKNAAAQAAQAGASKLGPLGPALLAADLMKNPWHVAKNRSDKTGVVMGDLLARTEAASYVLIGHSLGARAMVVTAQTLASKSDRPPVEAVHLLGAAIGAKSDWTALAAAVDGTVYNYHSARDKVLKLPYTAVQGGQTAAGLNGFAPRTEGIENIDVSAVVEGHSAYFEKVALR